MDLLVPSAFVTAPRPGLRIFLCGDVMTGRGVDQVLPHPGDPTLYEPYVSSAADYVRLAERRNGPIPKPVDFAYVWGAALDEWAARRPDARIVNLETSITTSDDYAPKGINYRMNPANAACLAASGADCCVLANNHVLDWGEDGLLETLAVLRRLGIAVCGAGRNAAEAAAPAILPGRGASRVVVAAMCTQTSGAPESWAASADRPGVNLVEPGVAAARRLASELAAVRRPHDVVVASIHWGPNWGYEIAPAHRAFAHALIDVAGVAIVHGHSSHHPLAIEVHDGRLILYGCGDFLNDYEGIEGHEAFRGELGLGYFADLAVASGELAALEMAPLQVRHFRVSRPSDEDVGWLRTRLDRECRRFGCEVRQAGRGFALAWPKKRGPPSQAGQS